MSIIMYGKPLATELKEKISKEVASLKENGKISTCAFIRVGDKSDSVAYENAAVKVLSSLGIDCVRYTYPENISENEFLLELDKIGSDDNIDAFLLLRPLPSHINDELVCTRVNPKKDIDGVSPFNIGELFYQKKDIFAPCTAESVMRIIEYYNIDLTGKNAVVIGRSNVIGKPVSMMLLAKNATVTICHSKTKNLQDICKSADIIVAAIGKAKFITKDFIKEGAVIVDVGTNYDANGKVVGDVDFDAVSSIASHITPVPGGVGSITTTLLAEKCLITSKRNYTK